MNFSKSLITSVLAIACASCIVPQVTQRPGAPVSFADFKTAAYSVHATPATEYGSDRRFSEEEISLFDALLGRKLESMGYAKPDASATPDLKIDIAITESKEGSAGARFWIGMGAGRAVFTFDATFVDSSGRTIAAFQGGRSYTGMEFGKAFADAEDIKTSAATRATAQVEEFIRNNGSLPQSSPATAKR